MLGFKLKAAQGLSSRLFCKDLTSLFLRQGSPMGLPPASHPTRTNNITHAWKLHQSIIWFYIECWMFVWIALSVLLMCSVKFWDQERHLLRWHISQVTKNHKLNHTSMVKISHFWITPQQLKFISSKFDYNHQKEFQQTIFFKTRTSSYHLKKKNSF